MTYMPMQEVVECQGCGKEFLRINRTRNHIIVKKTGRPRTFCEECAAYRVSTKGRRELKEAKANERGAIE